VPEAALKFSEADLRNWNLLEHFRKVVLPLVQAAPKSPTELDPRHQLVAEEYFSLFLFRMLNPIITSMRGLCAATKFKKMRSVCRTPVAPSSFSEAQHLFDPEILAQVVRRLGAQAHGMAGFGDARVREAIKALTIVDGTVLRAVNRMAWSPAAGFGSALRLHLHFSVYDQVPTDWSITAGNASEAKEWKKKIKTEEFYIVDRLYGQDLLYLKQLQKRGGQFVVRICQNVVRTPVGPDRPLTDADRKAGVISDRVEELGLFGGGPALRLVEVHAQGKVFLLATTRQDLPAEVISLIYRYRWQVELFFKWLKTMLPCEHWLAESPRGATFQIYCLLIAALLLLLWTGRRPNKRQMEALWFYWTGFVDADELAAVLKNSN
jgi:Transposase DDE domain